MQKFLLLLVLLALTQLAASQTCSGVRTFTNVTGGFEDGSGNGNYGNNMNCTWVIFVQDAQSIQITFSNFDLDTVFNDDSVSIYSGTSIDSSRLVRTLVGNIIPGPTVTVSGNSFVLNFRTGPSLGTSGWALTYTASFCVFTANSSSGQLSDPQGAANYSPNLRCRYDIIPVSPSATLRIAFTQFGVSIGDWLIVSENGFFRSALNGTTIPPVLTSITPGNSLRMNFTTDTFNQGVGFTFFFDNQFCSGTTTFTELTRSFTDGSGALTYGNYQYCRYLIKAYSKDTRTRLTFNAFDLESGYDFLSIYDGPFENSTLIQSFTGNAIPTSLVGTGGSDMLVVFESDLDGSAGGFNITFTREAAAYTPPTLTGCTYANPSGCSCPTGTTCTLFPDLAINSNSISYSEAPGAINFQLKVSNVGLGPLMLQARSPATCYCNGVVAACNSVCAAGLVQSVDQVIQTLSTSTGTIANTTQGAGNHTYSANQILFDSYWSASIRTNTGGQNPLIWPVVGGAQISYRSSCLTNYLTCAVGGCPTATPVNSPLGTDTACGLSQSLRTGYLDIFNANTYGVKITLNAGFCNGNYQLVFALDPNGLIAEVNETNNIVTFPIALTQQSDCSFVVPPSPVRYPSQCRKYYPTGLPSAIPDFGSGSLNNIISVNDNFTITFVNLVAIRGTHPLVADLVFTFSGPDTTSVTLASALCDGPTAYGDFYYSSADFATQPISAISCPPVNNGLFRPMQSFVNAFANKNSRGNWRLTISDLYAGSTGLLQDYYLEICGDAYVGAPITTGGIVTTGFPTTRSVSTGRVTSGRVTSGGFTTALTTNVILGARGTTGTTNGWTPLATTSEPTTGIDFVKSSASSLPIYVTLLLLVVVFI